MVRRDEYRFCVSMVARSKVSLLHVAEALSGQPPAQPCGAGEFGGVRRSRASFALGIQCGCDSLQSPWGKRVRHVLCSRAKEGQEVWGMTETARWRHAVCGDRRPGGGARLGRLVIADFSARFLPDPAQNRPRDPQSANIMPSPRSGVATPSSTRSGSWSRRLP